MYLTRDGGVKWTDVTPKDMAKFTRVSSIDASKFGECIAYVAANRFQLDDNKPYLWKTTDCGAHWTRIDNGIAATEFTRVVREDPNKRGLLVAGTERGVWFRRTTARTGRACGSTCRSFPCTISSSRKATSSLATHGRSFYIMDDISTLEQMTDAVVAESAHLFQPRDQYRIASGGGFGGGGRGGGGGDRPRDAGERARPSDRPESADRASSCSTGSSAAAKTSRLDFLDATGKVIRSYTSKQDSAAAPPRAEPPRKASAPPPAGARRRIKQGVNTFVWNMRYPDASNFPGMILWAANVTGPLVPPGTYKVRMTVARQAGRHGDVQDPSRPAHQGDARRLAGAVAPRAAGSRSLLRSERRGEGDPPRQDRSSPTAREARRRRSKASSRRSSTPFGDGDRGGRGLALPDEESQRPGPAQLSDPAQQSHRRAARRRAVERTGGRRSSPTTSTRLSRRELDERSDEAAKSTERPNLPKINAMLKAAGLKEIEAKGPIS